MNMVPPNKKRPTPLARKTPNPEMTWWHNSALRMFREGANTIGIAALLRTTEADAYNLLAQAREAEQQTT